MKKTDIYALVILLYASSFLSASPCGCLKQTKPRKDSRTKNYIMKRKKSETDTVVQWLDKNYDDSSKPKTAPQKKDGPATTNHRIALEEFITIYGSITGFAGMCLLVALGLN